MLVEAMLMLAADPAAIRCRGVSLTGAVDAYARRTRAMDVRGVAAFYGNDGVTMTRQGELKGSEAIAAFLNGFRGYRVTGEVMRIGSTTAVRGGWRTEGRYLQSGKAPGGKPYTVHGRFKMEWRCDRQAGWRVRRTETGSD